MEPWKTAITAATPEGIYIRGHNLVDLMQETTFTDVIFLLHRSRLPTVPERRLLNAILIAGADHGPGAPSALAARTVASGNRHSFEAAVAAGVLAIGDAHGGAGLACMEMIAAGIALADRHALPLPAAASRVVAEAVAAHRRLPGLGHRFHQVDPRATVIFEIAASGGLAGKGVAFLKAVQDAVREQIRPLPINVDGAIAATLYDLGFPPVLAKALFIVARVAGLTAHVQEEYERERPMRIRIPVVYDGSSSPSNGTRPEELQG